MVQAVRSGASLKSVAVQFDVSVGNVAFWVRRAQGKRLDRADFSDRSPGCARGWNRTGAQVEQRIVDFGRACAKTAPWASMGPMPSSGHCARSCLTCWRREPRSIASLGAMGQPMLTGVCADPRHRRAGICRMWQRGALRWIASTSLRI